MTNSRLERLGDNIGTGLKTLVTAPIVGVKKLGSGLLLGVSRAPFGEKLWAAKLKRDLKQYRKASDGDLIGFIARDNGQLDVEAMKLKQDADDETTQKHFATLSTNETFDAAPSGGQALEYIGDTPVGLFYEDCPRMGSIVEGAVTEALDLGQGRPLYSNPQITKVEVTPEAVQEMDEGGPGAAIADGGEGLIEYQVSDLEAEMQDFLVDIGVHDGDDGRHISLEKLGELETEKVGTEQLKRAEHLGEMKARDQNQGPSITKILFYVMITITIVVLGFTVLGDAGSSIAGGGVMPF